MPHVVKVHVLYCGGWGYAPKASTLGQQLKQEFGEDVSFEMAATPETTGKFEVTVADKLVHSKDGGDGFVDSEAKFQKIVEAIDEAMGWKFW